MKKQADGKFDSRSNGILNQHNCEDLISVPDHELTQLNADMFKAVKRAKHELEERRKPRQPWLVLRLAGVAIAAIAIFLAWPHITPNHLLVEAASFEGINGIVVSASSRKPVAGIVVMREAASTQGSAQPQQLIVDITDSTGTFSIPPDETAKPQRFTFELEGIEVGYLQSGDSERSVKDRFVRIEIGNLSESGNRRFEYPVQLIPGDTSKLGETISVSNFPEAKSTWDGSLTHNLAWPAIFNHARVVGGIFTANGDPTEQLELAVTIPADKIAYYGASSSELQLIANDVGYAEDYEAGAAQHHGWYDTSNPPAGYALPSVGLLVENAGDEYVASWNAQPGIKYALVLPPKADGEVFPCFVNNMIGSTPGKWTKTLYLGNHSQPQMSIYDVEYKHQAANDPWLANTLPLHPTFTLNLEAELMLGGQKKKAAFSKAGEAVDVPGTFTVQRYDFLYSSSADYEPISASFTKPTGGFGIAVDQGDIGETTRVSVTGDLSQLTERIAWDLNGDRVTDAWGESAEIVVPYACAFKVTATIKAESGIYVVNRTLGFTNDKVVGFLAGIYGPIIHGQPALPPTGTSYITMTPEMVTSQVSFGYSASGFLGPVALINPPPDFRNKPLDKIKIVFFASAMAGETDVAYLVPNIYVTEDGNATGPALTSNYKPLLANQPNFVDVGYGNLSRDVDLGLSAQRNGTTLTDYLTTRLEWNLIDIPRQFTFKIGLGVDVNNLPGEEQLLLIYRNFRESELYSIRYANGDKLEISWTNDLHGLSLDSNDGLIVAIGIETCGHLNDAQWEIFSGGGTPARIELTAENGATYTAYIDYSQL